MHYAVGPGVAARLGVRHANGHVQLSSAEMGSAAMVALEAAASMTCGGSQFCRQNQVPGRHAYKKRMQAALKAQDSPAAQAEQTIVLQRLEARSGKAAKPGLGEAGNAFWARCGSVAP